MLMTTTTNEGEEEEEEMINVVLPFCVVGPKHIQDRYQRRERRLLWLLYSIPKSVAGI